MDAVIVAAIVGGLILMGFLPFSTDSGAPDDRPLVLVSLAVAAVAVLKGKIFMGVAGMLFLPIAVIGAIRLAKPDSSWARRRYPEGSRKRLKSEHRYERHTRRYQRFQDTVAGAPSRESES